MSKERVKLNGDENSMGVLLSKLDDAYENAISLATENGDYLLANDLEKFRVKLVNVRVETLESICKKQ